MSTGFSFGAKTTATPTYGSTNLTFGAAAIQPQNQPFGIQTPAISTPSLFNPAPSVPAATSGLFGATQAGGLFGTTTATTMPTLSFGPSTALTPTTFAGSLGLGFGGTPASTTATPSFGLNVGQTATSSSVPTVGFSLGGTTTTSENLSKVPGSSVTTPSTSGLTFGLGSGVRSVSTLPPTTSTVIGLGGIATTTQAQTVTKKNDVPPKGQLLPNEILQTVEAFKAMVKQQKAHSSEISRCSIREFRRVEQEIKQLSNTLTEVEKQLQQNRQIAEKLKYDTAKTVQTVELAQTTHDTPSGLQYENTAPLKFFLNLADQFEYDMQSLKRQINNMEKYVKNHSSPDLLTSEDLSVGMKKLHGIFVALAGQLQAVHKQVESQKDHYLSLRRRLLRDSTNPFEKLTRTPEFQTSPIQNTIIRSPPKVAAGPTPFNNLALKNMAVSPPQQPTAQPPVYPGTSIGGGFASGGFSTSFGTPQPSNTSLFGTTNFGQSSLNNSFQLQKPPTGNKRGKT
ncbi:hypothetical protein ABEB36_003867 [Hypothenemus hampei]|uniref:Nucleoporin p58/p45 n=1 Tax=Hypothenemus hampei TaxID=57062 RepID=A0ABD1F1D9_HYPHA